MSAAGEIQPGATLGVLGGGQLGRMFAIAARRMGYRVHVLSPEADSPAAQVCDQHVRGEYRDETAVSQFAQSIKAATIEFENIPAESLQIVERHVPVRPRPAALSLTQDRIREKCTLADRGFPVTPFFAVQSPDDLSHAADTLGAPAVLKAAASGYDGKGQVRIDSPAGAIAAWDMLGRVACVWEQWIDFQAELSVIAARGENGDIATYGPFRNTHERHILDTTACPAGLPDHVRDNAVALARAIAESLDHVGLLCVEMFLAADGGLLVNELAPRPHNSGHLTIEAHETSQFEQQVRTLCCLPLGSTAQRCPAAMANLLGDLWSGGEPDWSRLSNWPDVHLHLYGKQKARPGRKMGHLTATAQTAAAALERVVQARQALISPE